jgi:choline-sulfatase
MSRRWYFGSLALGVLLSLAVGAVIFGRQQSHRYNLVFLTVESFRADFIRPDLTPNLLAAAETGIRFTGHRAVSAWTAPNILAILTGQSSFAQGVHAQRQSIPVTWKTPLETLGNQGWSVFGLQSFMQVDAFRGLGLGIQPGQELIPWLRDDVRNAEPFAVWYHYLGTHLPYAPSQAFRPDWEALLPPGDMAARERIQAVMTHAAIPMGSVDFQASDIPAISALHAGSYREFDQWFAGFWEFFNQSGLRRNTILVVTADHADEHLERGHVGHASTTHDGHLHEELVRIPLFVWLPPELGDSPVRVIDRPTDHLDIIPTVLRRLGIKPDMAMPGDDLLEPKKAREKASVWMALTSKAGFQEPKPEDVRMFKAARIEGNWKLLLDFEDDRIVGRQLFDLNADPGERMDLAGQRRDIADRIQAPLEAAFRARRLPESPASQMVAGLAPPHWIAPSAGGPMAYDAVAGGFHMEWTGSPTGKYIIEYQAGQGPLSVRGELDVMGTAKSFGPVDRSYWDNFIVPYKTVRLRVGLAGSDERWSDWLVLMPRS